MAILNSYGLTKRNSVIDTLSTCYGRNDVLAALGLLAITLLVYANSMRNGFVWDDFVVVLNNPVLKDTPASLFDAIDATPFLGTTPYYRPLTFLTFMLDRWLHDFNPFFVRIFNVLLHATNAVLVYVVARSYISNRFQALLVGLLFVVHPINSESVNFYTIRTTALSCFFILVTYLIHNRATLRESNKLAVCAALTFLAGLFSKETVVMIMPFIVFLEMSHRCKSHNGQKLLQSMIIRMIPYILAMACYMYFRQAALAKYAVQLQVTSGFGSRLMDNLFIIPRYLLTVIWPPSLSIRYFVPQNLQSLFLPLAAAWCFIIAVLGWLLTRGRSRATLFGVIWLVVFWLPTSGIVYFPSAPMADRFMYVAAIGLWFVIADQLGRFILPGFRWHKYSVAVVSMVIITLAWATYARNQVWKNDVTLFTHYITQYPEFVGGYYNLGAAYLEQERNLDKAELYFNKALTLDPSFPRLHTSSGYVRLQRGDLTGALQHYTEALRLNPADAEAQLNSGVVFEKLMRYNDAIDAYRRFLALPDNTFVEARLTIESKILDLSNRYYDAMTKRSAGTVQKKYQ